MEDLTPTETQQEFARTAGRLMADCAGKSSRWISRWLGDAGLMNAMVPERSSGLGAGVRDALPLAVACATYDVAFPVVESMIASAGAVKSGLESSTNLITGRQVATLAWHGALEVGGKFGAEQLNGVVSHAVGASVADWVVLRVRRGGDDGIGMLPVNSPGVSCRSGNELDLGLHDFDLVFDNVDVSKARIAWDDGANWLWIQSAGDVLRSAESYGCARASFDSAKAYTSQRSQFRRHLCANQTVRHLLARDYYGLENVRYCLEFAALLTDQGSDEAAMAIDILCGIAAENCVRAAENAIQLHGAMGFTSDMPLHRRLRRILATTDIRPARLARENLVVNLLQSWQ